MPATVPAYVQALPVLHLRRLIASSAAFRTWAEAASEQAAFDDAIFYVDVPTLPGTGKYAVINPPFEGLSIALTPHGAPRAYEVARQILFELRGVRTTTDPFADQMMDFWNMCGAFLQEIVTNSGTTGSLGARLAFGPIEGEGPYLSHEDIAQDDDPHIVMRYAVECEIDVI